MIHLVESFRVQVFLVQCGNMGLLVSGHRGSYRVRGGRCSVGTGMRQLRGSYEVRGPRYEVATRSEVQDMK